MRGMIALFLLSLSGVGLVADQLAAHPLPHRHYYPPRVIVRPVYCYPLFRPWLWGRTNVVVTVPAPPVIVQPAYCPCGTGCPCGCERTGNCTCGQRK
jgi:hypothetical protein